MTSQSRIQTLYLSQEDLLRAGCLDMGMAMEVAEQAMLAFLSRSRRRRGVSGGSPGSRQLFLGG